MVRALAPLYCSVLGPTWPNRLYHMSAWIDPAGVAGGPIISNIDPTPYGWKTYPEALTEAGVSWQVYPEVDNYQCNLLEMFASFTAPAGTAGEYVDGLPIGGGFRVPCIIVSPWTQGGWIASDTFDHTSVLRTRSRCSPRRPAR